MILAPNTTSSGAEQLAERVLDAFRSGRFGESKVEVALTVSVGVVSEAVADESIAEALRARADEALYAAKRRGRNRMEVWSHGLDSWRMTSRGPEEPAAPP